MAVGIGVAPWSAAADPVRDSQWHLAFLNVVEAHRLSQGEGVLVAVIDTGVDASHRDLAGAVRPGTDIYEPGGDGRKDIDGHGTAMTGLIAARGTDGGSGALGIAPKATVLPVRTGGGFLDPPSHLAKGIEWAALNGARVISLSGGGGDKSTYDDALAAAAEHDAVVVAAVGNTPKVSSVIFPAASPGVLAAGGVGKDGTVAAISARGKAVDLVAPAVDIISTDRNGEYGRSIGTSDATAIVAGAAALVRAKYPHLKAQQVIDRLTSTATDKGPPGHDSDYGYGVLNLVAALTGDVDPAPNGPDGDGDSGPNRVLIGALSIAALLGAAGVLATGVILLRRRRLL